MTYHKKPAVEQIQFSKREQTQKNHIVQNAIDAADLIISQNKRYEGMTLNLSGLERKGLSPKDKVTIVELNDISDMILRDSGFKR